jgi:hypothetical protein
MLGKIGYACIMAALLSLIENNANPDWKIYLGFSVGWFGMIIFDEIFYKK